MAQNPLKPLTPEIVAMESLRQFEEAMKTLESACCLYAEFTDLGDPYDDHEQPHRRDLQQTYHSKFSKKLIYIVTTPCFLKSTHLSVIKTV